MSDLGEDGGWIASTDAWIRLVQDHPTRTLLLGGFVLEELGDVAGRPFWTSDVAKDASPVS
jgi:hypothetical protein